MLAFAKACAEPFGSSSILPYRSFVPPAVSQSAKAKGFARRAGRNSRSSNRLTACDWVFHLPMTLGLACCQRSPIHRLTTARAVARYNDVASTLVHGLKYSDRLDLSPMMADALVPVPLHWRRRWARRYINRPFLPAQYRRFAGSLSRTAAQTYPCHTAAGRLVSNRARR